MATVRSLSASQAFSDDIGFPPSGYDGEVVVAPGTVTPMSTAIARIYTPEGFIIATDGRATNDDGTWFEAQKLFPLQSARKLAYVLAGTAAITPKNSSTVVFDFVGEVVKAANRLDVTAIRSLYDYAARLATFLDVGLKEASKAAGIPPPNPDIEEHSKTSIFIEGYYGKHPKRARIEFTHDGQDQTRPEVSMDDLKYQWWGSKEIASVLFDEADPRLAAYKIAEYKMPTVQPRTLTDAIQMAERYVSAHCDPEAVSIDRSVCSHCGPPIHIAKITSSEGFQWVRR